MTVDYKALKMGGFMRQKEGDRFSVRVRVTGGNLTTDQLRTIVKAADRFGDGHVHMTSRQQLEIPAVMLEDVDKIKTFLNDGGVFSGVCGPRVRSVTACQGADICPSGCIRTYPLAQELMDRYYGRQLPTKFKFGVTGCRNNCLKIEENDIGVKGGLIVSWSSTPCTFCSECAKVCRVGAIEVGEDSFNLDRGK
ncbi:MAG: coenzyme F420 hydrogenase, partial [Deltaproteobacteria bacterium]|nr:coenzyme F420 hydrogenase [Deltaproteobacteria bacterium]